MVFYKRGIVMKFNVLFNTAFKDIIKNKKRSLLTMMGIIIGIAAVITIIAIGRGSPRKILEIFHK